MCARCVARDDAGRPNAPFLATGTMAGAIDLSFSTTACLEIFSTDYASMETEMESVGRAVPSTERFHRLVWGSGGKESEETRRRAPARPDRGGSARSPRRALHPDSAPTPKRCWRSWRIIKR